MSIDEARRLLTGFTDGRFDIDIDAVRVLLRAHDELAAEIAVLRADHAKAVDAHALKRFWAQVDKSGGEQACWPWLGVQVKGYGKFHTHGKNYRAHRFSYERHVGPVPQGMCVCHRCDNPRCVNPAHLFLGSPVENTKDRNDKSRQARGERIGLARLTEERVRLLRERVANGETYAAIARDYGVGPDAIGHAARRETWGWVS